LAKLALIFTLGPVSPLSPGSPALPYTVKTSFVVKKKAIL